jgi:hypothetical protein
MNLNRAVLGRRSSFPAIVAMLACFATTGCGADVSDDQEALITLAITTTPPGVLCMQATAIYSKPSQTKVVGGNSADQLSSKMKSLPAGQAIVLLEGFAVACNRVVATTEPTWVSDPFTLTLVKNAPVVLNATMMENGRIDLSVDFAYDK